MNTPECLNKWFGLKGEKLEVRIEIDTKRELFILTLVDQPYDFVRVNVWGWNDSDKFEFVTKNGFTISSRGFLQITSDLTKLFLLGSDTEQDDDLTLRIPYRFKFDPYPLEKVILGAVKEFNEYYGYTSSRIIPEFFGE